LDFPSFGIGKIRLLNKAMKLFINDHYIRILSAGKEFDYSGHLQVSSLKAAEANALSGSIFLQDARVSDMRVLLDWIEKGSLAGQIEIICQSNEPAAMKEFVKKQFRIIEAAGGLVRKEENFLLIHRLGKWDLPKGKLEKGESMKEAAIREVEEECGIKVELGEKICNTWHSYLLDGKRTLKKTAWYSMNCLDDANMQPQKEEGIEQIKWMSEAEASPALFSSYRSIRAVLENYLEKGKSGLENA